MIEEKKREEKRKMDSPIKSENDDIYGTSCFTMA
jgi:hypothetical protein